MSGKIAVLDGAERIREKQVSRDLDAALLASGQITAAELIEKNAFFHSVPFERFELVAIGGIPLEEIKNAK